MGRGADEVRRPIGKPKVEAVEFLGERFRVGELHELVALDARWRIVENPPLADEHCPGHPAGNRLERQPTAIVEHERRRATAELDIANPPCCRSFDADVAQRCVHLRRALQGFDLRFRHQ